MTAFINPPARLPLLLRLGVWIVQRVAGQDLLLARLLAWYPRAAFSSGVLEALIAHHEGALTERLLKLVRLQVSFAAQCPFCIDMNSAQSERFDITPAELAALRGRQAVEAVPTFSARERVALAYARQITLTPLKFPPELITAVKDQFDEREIVVLATTAAQVNYWTRLIQALGVPPARPSGSLPE
jgi:AhpD family alkylhydroperoxidase